MARPYVRSGPILAEAAWAQLGHHGYGLSGSDWWLVVALHTHAEVWQIAVQYGATAATPSGSIPEQADSGARGQAEWAGGIAWLDDPAGALAVSRCVASLGFSGPQVREEWRWLPLAR